MINVNSDRPFPHKVAVMQRALELARTGQGRVEPNPCVGAVVVDDQLRLLGEGCHEQFGGPHAEVMALRRAGAAARNATIFVTLEPCCHHGKTPPCTDAVIAAGIRKVVIATSDPAAHGAGSGVEILRKAGLDVEIGLCEAEARELIAPFQMLMNNKRPFVHAKWAMTLDGRIATRTGSSKWISNEQSRALVHQLRGRVDGIITGIGTVLADDPLLTARPAGPRIATRIVLDSDARLPLNSQLVRTVDQGPVLAVVTSRADSPRLQALQASGVEVWVAESNSNGRCDLSSLLQELGRRKFTNVLLEAGSGILGGFHDENLIDEVHCFIAPRLVGGEQAPGPVGGEGVDLMAHARRLINPVTQILDGDVYIRGRIGTNRE
ncbi:bifunctional diaminohydroxyphosphoribosylaminopyrimidine deaminase/5-amino-6-(5-phosphoribosylamino)uracil reductase RibD [Planctomicrobium sp. SH661]|uniref:bifunctional diaminohydroxyphosphoribosylaminopyrimidine deaminase/5-amino-6-(5-phosphoribosylamino)uracil reductase RibD n=1 Tax=Planctomicrobium sp. SH661 TaxID=3448124 RepID=UPI003F5C8BC0